MGGVTGWAEPPDCLSPRLATFYITVNSRTTVDCQEFPYLSEYHLSKTIVSIMHLQATKVACRSERKHRDKPRPGYNIWVV